MSLDTDFQFWLTGQVTIPVQQNYESRDKTEPRIWYQRRDDVTDLFLVGTPGQRDAVFNVEVMGLDPDATALIADAVKTKLNGFRGWFRTSPVLGCFVTEADDEYQPRGLDFDDGYHVFAFTVRVIT